MKKHITEVQKLQKTAGILNEFRRTSLENLTPVQKKQVLAFEKIIGGKHTQIFDGIHGVVVDIDTPDIRLTSEKLKKLLVLKIRWIETDVDLVSIGF